MHFLSSKLKRFDVHTKTIDGVNDQQTFVGAIFTIITVLLVFILVTSEVGQFMTINLEDRMIPDSTVGVEDVAIQFDITFEKTPCNKISFSQEVTRGTLHSHQPDQIDKEVLEGRSCWIHGKILTDKVGGSFRFMVEPDVDGEALGLQPPGIPGQPPVAALTHHDISHKINRLAFIAADGPNIDETEEDKELAQPLTGQQSPVDTDIGVYQYHIQVVPTFHSKLASTDSYHVNQYSVTERQIPDRQLKTGVILNGQTYRNVVGVVFTYDFYPVMLVREESSESSFAFFSNLCAIVGGCITLLGLIEQTIHQSTKALIGKKD